jgi:hypothetical protein
MCICECVCGCVLRLVGEGETFFPEQTGHQVIFSNNLDLILWKESLHKYVEILLSTFLKIYFEFVCVLM